MQSKDSKAESSPWIPGRHPTATGKQETTITGTPRQPLLHPQRHQSHPSATTKVPGLPLQAPTWVVGVEMHPQWQTNEQKQGKAHKAEMRMLIKKAGGRKNPFGLWKQAVDSLKLGINSIYTNAVQAIKFGHGLSGVRSHWSDCKSYRIHKMLQTNTAERGWKEPQSCSGLPFPSPACPTLS